MAERLGTEVQLLSKLESSAALTDEELQTLQSHIDELEMRADSHHETSVSNHHSTET